MGKQKKKPRGKVILWNDATDAQRKGCAGRDVFCLDCDRRLCFTGTVRYGRYGGEGHELNAAKRCPECAIVHRRKYQREYQREYRRGKLRKAGFRERENPFK